MYRRYLQYWRVFFLLYLTRIACLRHLWDVRPYVLLSVFMFSGPFVEVFSSSSLKMVPSILQLHALITLMRFLLYCLASSRFLVLPRYTIKIFLRLFDGVRLHYSTVFVSFLFSERSDFFLIWLSYSFRYLSFSVSHYHHGIFLCRIPSLYLDCISSLLVLGFPVLFHFWYAVWCHLRTLGG